MSCLDLTRQVSEGALLCSARLVFGDEQVAEWVFEQEYDAELAGRHSHQLAGLYTAKHVPDEYTDD